MPSAPTMTCASINFGPSQFVAGENMFRAEPLAHGIKKNALQLSAMDRILWKLESGINAARLTQDRLASGGFVNQLAGADADAVKLARAVVSPPMPPPMIRTRIV